MYKDAHVNTNAGWNPLYEAINDGFGDMRNAFIEAKKVCPIKTSIKTTIRNIIIKTSPADISFEIDVKTSPTCVAKGIKRNGKQI